LLRRLYLSLYYRLVLPVKNNFSFNILEDYYVQGSVDWNEEYRSTFVDFVLDSLCLSAV
jgi:hypothetical protein